MSGRTITIPDRQMREFMDVCEEISAKVGAPEPKQHLQDGLRVTVKKGPMVGYHATVKNGKPDGGGRIVVEVSGKRLMLPLAFL